MLSNCTEWSNANEGAESLSIEYLPTEETQTFIYDQGIEVYLNWHIDKVYASNELPAASEDNSTSSDT